MRTALAGTFSSLPLLGSISAWWNEEDFHGKVSLEDWRVVFKGVWVQEEKLVGEFCALELSGCWKVGMQRVVTS